MVLLQRYACRVLVLTISIGHTASPSVAFADLVDATASATAVAGLQRQQALDAEAAELVPARQQPCFHHPGADAFQCLSRGSSSPQLHLLQASVAARRSAGAASEPGPPLSAPAASVADLSTSGGEIIATSAAPPPTAASGKPVDEQQQPQQQPQRQPQKLSKQQQQQRQQQHQQQMQMQMQSQMQQQKKKKQEHQEEQRQGQEEQQSQQQQQQEQQLPPQPLPQLHSQPQPQSEVQPQQHAHQLEQQQQQQEHQQQLQPQQPQPDRFQHATSWSLSGASRPLAASSSATLVEHAPSMSRRREDLLAGTGTAEGETVTQSSQACADAAPKDASETTAAASLPNEPSDEDSESELPAIFVEGSKSPAGVWLIEGFVVFVLLLLATLGLSYPSQAAPSTGIVLLWLLYAGSQQSVARFIAMRAGCPRGGGRRWLLGGLDRVLRMLQRLRRSRQRDWQIRSTLTLLTAYIVLSGLFSLEVISTLISRVDTSGLATPFTACLFLVVVIASGGAVRGIKEPWGARQRSDDFEGSEIVRSAIRHLRKCLDEGSRRGKLREAEQSVLDALTECEKHVLNELLEQISSDLLSKVLGKFRNVVSLLCFELCDSLAARSKSHLINVLMSMESTSRKDSWNAVENLLLSTHGDGLSELKCIQDGRGNENSIRNLLFNDIVDRRSRKRILDHFLAEGLAQVGHRTLLASRHFMRLLRKAQERNCVHAHMQFMGDNDDPSSVHIPYNGRCFSSWRKIMFDVDDTLQCSAGPPAGIDKRYPKHAVYPGFIAFLRELHGGDKTSQLVALSARPDILENGVVRRFRRLQSEHGLHAMPSLLLGELDTGFEFLVKGGEEGMSELVKTKYLRVQEYIRLYPEFRFVFLGDNGQGDYAVGHMMHERFPDNLEQVFIHKVQDVTSTPFYSVYGSRSDAPVEFVDDYVMAAVSALRRSRPLISLHGLLRIVLAAEKDFAEIAGWPSEEQKRVEEMRLFASIRHARGLLHELGALDEPPAALAEEEDTGAAPGKSIELARLPDDIHAEPTALAEAAYSATGELRAMTPATPPPLEAMAADGITPFPANHNPAGLGKEDIVMVSPALAEIGAANTVPTQQKSVSASSGHGSRSFLTWLPRVSAPAGSTPVVAVMEPLAVVEATVPSANSSPARCAKVSPPSAATDGSTAVVNSSDTTIEHGNMPMLPASVADEFLDASTLVATALPSDNSTAAIAVTTVINDRSSSSSAASVAVEAAQEIECVAADTSKAVDKIPSE